MQAVKPTLLGVLGYYLIELYKSIDYNINTCIL